MEVGKRYLVKHGQNSTLREFRVLEVSEVAVKVQNEVEEGWGILTHSRKPFWILKSSIDKIGQTEYQIFEELKD